MGPSPRIQLQKMLGTGGTVETSSIKIPFGGARVLEWGKQVSDGT